MQVFQVPIGCSDEVTGAAYWAFVNNPATVPACSERVRLLQHAVACPACIRQVLEGLRQPGDRAAEQPHM